MKRVQGDLAGALQGYEDSRAIAEKLAAADPGNAEWQRDLIVSAVKLAEPAAAAEDRPQAAEWYAQALRTADKLAAEGRLAPADAWMVDALKSRLASVAP